MKNLSMKVKLFIVLGILTVVSITVATIGITKLRGMNDRLNKIVNVAAEKVKLANVINEDLLRIARAEKNLILETDAKKMEQYAQTISTTKEQVKGNCDKLRELLNESEKPKLDQFLAAWNSFLDVDKQVCELGQQNSNTKAQSLSRNEARQAFDEVRNVIAGLASTNTAALEKSLTDANRQADVQTTRKALLCKQIETTLLEMQRGEKNMILAETDEEMDRIEKDIEGLMKDVQQYQADLSQIADAQEKAALTTFAKQYSDWLVQHQQVKTLTRQNSNKKAFEMSANQGRQYINQSETLLTDLIKSAETSMAADVKTSDRNYAAAKLMMIAVSVVGIGMALGIGLVIVLGLTRTLGAIIQGLKEGSEQVTTAAGQVSAASQSLAEGATEQAAGLQETSSSLEEMSSMTKQNADNAQQANSLAAEARKAAGTGAESMSRMNAAIQEIQKSSDETAKIIKVIDEIAFQTNLLALNAAVEAARAGEAGKGFAVVAEEVRNLAMRSAEAAKNTSSMIEESVKNSKNGVDIAAEVSKVLDEIVQSVSKTTDLVSEIAAASQEQAQGIDQVNTAVAQMDKVTQQNAANAEESASASEELSSQAESMNEIVNQLVALVGGNAARSGIAQVKKTHHELKLSEHLKAIHPTEHALGKGHGFGKSDEAFHKIAHADKAAKPKAAARPATHKAIPLDSHEDDLKDFNG
jgi:methyl-accepting chemotaxis protein